MKIYQIALDNGVFSGVYDIGWSDIVLNINHLILFGCPMSQNHLSLRGFNENLLNNKLKSFR
jgi:hypothetical protein